MRNLKTFNAVIFAGMVSLIFAGCGGSSTSNPPPPAVHNEWTWVSGAEVSDQNGNYGTMGVAAPSNVPGARGNAVSWTDANGDFWLFGGFGIGSTGVQPKDLNDLWKFSGGQWTWVSGSNQTEQAGIYGTQGVGAVGNIPGARWEAVSWTNASGLWLFGGLGVDSTGTRGALNDLWRYSDGQWIWMSGSNLSSDSYLLNQPGVYGTLGTAAPGNVPGMRVNANSWSDASGDLWLFGGEGFDSIGNQGILNDLWKYSGGQWTWMSGSNLVNQNGTYGTLGTAAPSNVPGARTAAVTWTDASGNLWLFGGEGNSSIGISCGAGPCDLNDLWKYSGGQWTWMGGTNQYDQPGIYGTQGLASPGNMPGARWFAMSWTDSAGNFWLFGGNGCDSTGVCTLDLNDLWKFSGGQWTWVSGSNLADQAGNYGALGTPAPGNAPECRQGAAGWTDKSGNLWLLGGEDFCIGNGVEKLNDLWEYQP